jgi:hypothetical protein
MPQNMETDTAISIRIIYKLQLLRVVEVLVVRSSTLMDMLWLCKLEEEVMVLRRIISYLSTDPCELYDAYKRGNRSREVPYNANG